MILSTEVTHPSQRSYVLKLHRDARPEQGLLVGRLENLVSGRRYDFRCAGELLTWLADDAASHLPSSHPENE